MDADVVGSTGRLSDGDAGGASSAAVMHHSHSTPAGVDGGGARTTPPATPKKGGKMLAIRVQMLDDSVTIFQVQVRGGGGGIDAAPPTFRGRTPALVGPGKVRPVQWGRAAVVGGACMEPSPENCCSIPRIECSDNYDSLTLSYSRYLIE